MKRKTSQERKKEIIRAAKELIIHGGIQEVTIKNISKRNKISEPAIYRHFRNKRAILVALIDNFEDNLMGAIDSPIRNYANPLDRLREIMKAHMIFTQERKGMLFAITAESVHFNDDFLRRKILGVIDKYKIRIKEILLEAKKENLLRQEINIEAVSLAFFGLIQAAIVQFALTNYTIVPLAKFQTLWNIFLKGIINETKKEKVNSA